jgi:hypothetical protein
MRCAARMRRTAPDGGIRDATGGTMTNILAAVALSFASSLSTNWHETHQTSTLMWPPESNIITHHEAGEVTSNLIARITYKDTARDTTLESTLVGFCYRSYTIGPPEKKYSDTTFEPVGPSYSWATNTGQILSITNFTPDATIHTLTNYSTGDMTNSLRETFKRMTNGMLYPPTNFSRAALIDSEIQFLRYFNRGFSTKTN